MSEEFTEDGYDEREFLVWMFTPKRNDGIKVIKKINLPTIEEDSYVSKPSCVRKPKYGADSFETEDDGYRNPGGGNGRPLSTDPAIKMISVRVTPAQHAKFLSLG